MSELLQTKIKFRTKPWPNCLHFAGVDGSGKSTIAEAITFRLRAEGKSAYLVWLRFPRLFCVPLLIYARLKGYSHYETLNGIRHGYWEFDRSWVMSTIFPWLLLLDTAIFTTIKIFLPMLRGRQIICDRFIIDILADLSVGLHDFNYYQSLCGRLLLALIPRDICIIVLDLDTDTAQERSPELLGDRSHTERRAAYLHIANRLQIPVISTKAPLESVIEQVVEVLNRQLTLSTVINQLKRDVV